MLANFRQEIGCSYLQGTINNKDRSSRSQPFPGIILVLVSGLGGGSRIASSLAETETWCLQHDASLQYDCHINIPSAELKNNVQSYQPLVCTGYHKYPFDHVEKQTCLQSEGFEQNEHESCRTCSPQSWVSASPGPLYLFHCCGGMCWHLVL